MYFYILPSEIGLPSEVRKVENLKKPPFLLDQKKPDQIEAKINVSLKATGSPLARSEARTKETHGKHSGSTATKKLRETMLRLAGRHVSHHRLMMSSENDVDIDALNHLNHLGRQERERPVINESLTPVNITGQLGATVYLHCVVHNLGQKTVTWLRRSDYHILTVGMMTYTTDERFSAVRGDGINDRDDWMLQIRAAQKADEDEYECQVNTQHPIISIIVKLNVLSPHAMILESPELYVNSGSTINLTCVIHDRPQPLAHIFWYHGDKVINYEPHSYITMLPPSRTRPDQDRSSTQMSRLLIHNADKHHTGKYTCAPVDSTPASVHVHVLHAEEHLARKSHEASAAAPTSNPQWSTSVVHAGLPLLALELLFLLVVARTT
ncbi:zwei Ig domain protein zig-8 [Galendromus occidentalis]|uniref:Zwei Ig domain protein zig-8 n=1 Tax=Galendromus occidentalis TaxID=34638 RepID=A0AAJ6QM56_9ACAR|nr:zwei Ig domain protein zig-8 [Galendromus occidentalis]